MIEPGLQHSVRVDTGFWYRMISEQLEVISCRTALRQFVAVPIGMRGTAKAALRTFLLRPSHCPQ